MTCLPSKILFALMRATLPQRLLRGGAAEVVRRQIDRSFVQTELATGDVEDRCNLLREDPLATTAHAPRRVIELAAAQIPDGGLIDEGHTHSPVNLDQLFDSLDSRTRAGLRGFIRGEAAAVEGRAPQANRTLRYFAPLLASTSDVTAELARDELQFDGLVVQGAQAMQSGIVHQIVAELELHLYAGDPRLVFLGGGVARQHK